MFCPHCGKNFQPLENQKFCSFCGGALDPTDRLQGPEHESGSFGYAEQPEIEEPVRQDEKFVPWEDHENVGFFRALVATLKGSLFSPAAFFSRLPVEGGFLNPFWFALIVQTIGNMAGLVWGVAGESPLFASGKASGAGMMLLGLMIPMFVGVFTFVAAGLLHISLFLVGGVKRDFEATFRVVAYSSGPDLFNVIPFIGSIIAGIWKIVLTIIGVSRVHDISTGRSAAAVFLPVVFCCGLMVAAALSILAGFSLKG